MRRFRIVFLPSTLAASALAAVICSSSACSRSVGISLQVVEPCDQRNGALNGVASYTLASSGVGNPTITTFKAGEGVPSLDVDLPGEGSDGVVVTLQAFPQDITGIAPSPGMVQAMGRTLPLALTEESRDLDVLVPVGRVDSFGRTTRADQECTSMDTGGAVAGRHGHTATYIPLIGKVLIYGGAVFRPDGTESILKSAELWDPATGEFESIEAEFERAYHAATALPDGRVVISGGLGVIGGQVSALTSADIFNPASRRFTQIALKQPRAHHTSSLMEKAGLLVLIGGCRGAGTASGCSSTSAGAAGGVDSTALQHQMEVLDVADVAAGTTAVPAVDSLTVGRAFHTVTVLDSSGNAVLVVAGGVNGRGPVADIELFSVSGTSVRKLTGDIQLATFPSGRAPARHAAVAVSDREILFIGGQTAANNGAPSGAPSADVWFFSTTSGVDAVPVQMQAGRAGHRAALLADGTILVVGGEVAGPDPATVPTAEVLVPQDAAYVARLVGRPMLRSLVGAALTPLPNGQVLVSGGYTAGAGGARTSSVEAHLFFPAPR